VHPCTRAPPSRHLLCVRAYLRSVEETRGPEIFIKTHGVASAAKDAARLVHTLNGMTEEEAQLFNLKNETLRRSLVRQDSAKLNIAPPAVDTVCSGSSGFL